MFKILSHTADTGIEVEAASLKELFIEAARGIKFCLIEDAVVSFAEIRKIYLKGANLEDLLVQWLSELNYLATVKNWIINEVVGGRIERKNREWELEFTIAGEPLDFTRHEILMDIKAVTYHQLRIEQKDGKFRTKIFFDI